ncbi:MAG: biotin/lipoyl-containing protein, partial [Candidatus Angelobacter sp.]
MPTDVVMPQMGESIFEGTITKWLKKPGEKVQRDEPLFEISTDKVDAEIPAPASGVLKEIKIQPGATVQVNTVVGVIDADGAGASSAGAPAQQPAPVQAQASPQQPAKTVSSPAPSSGTGAAPTSQPPAHPSAGAGGNGGGGGAAIDVVMPQMGESIFEGTITKWLKRPGDKVQRDEPLFEISTDKVDAEIPAPASGVLREIKVKEGATVQVNAVVATIGGAGTPASAAPAQPSAAPQTAPPAAQVPKQPAAAQPAASQQREQVISFPQAERGHAEVRSSPLVRRIARENNVDLSRVPGTGLGGRISKTDIQNFIQQYGPGAAQRAPQAPVHIPAQQTQQPQYAPPSAPPQSAAAPAHAPTPQLQQIPGEAVPMTPMRKKIAERMVESKHTSAHVHTIFKVDMTRIVRLREKTRKQWEARHGVKLTYMPFIAKALMHGIRSKPIVNSSVIG